MKLLTFCVALCAPYALAGQDSSVALNSRTSSVFDLVITEIMADPDPSNGLPNAEFVEILNRSASPVSLSGWTLFDGSSRILPDVTVLPGEFVTICNNVDTSQFATYGKCAGISSISLTNSGEKISLRDSFRVPVDSVVYSDTWYGSSYKNDGGWSLERIDADFNCPVADNWKASENSLGGTPGQINSIAGIIIDNSPPVLLRAYCASDSTIILVFNETIESAGISNLQNYITTPSISITNAAISENSKFNIRLEIAAPLLKQTIYSITVSGIQDCSGNMTSIGNTANFGVSDSVRKGDLIINEILFDPFEGGYDFIELFNSGNNIIDLSKLKIAAINPESNEPDEAEFISEVPWLLFPEEYIVITENTETVAQFYKSSFPYYFINIENLPSMNIDEGYIAILSSDVRLDEVHYFDEFHFDLLLDTKGISLEKINPDMNSMDAASWHSTAPVAGFATPGLKNSQYSDLIQNENTVTVFPEIFSPDNDGTDDVVIFSIHADEPGYISNFWLYNASGQVIYNQSKNNLLPATSIITWNGIDNEGNKASPGIYVALIDIFNLQGKVEKFKIPFVLALKF
ncbi:MAG TPA: lamin tail domain-containing protein [Bacteroidia bacterium]|nr:lamin tail domain-containing protein [Bacteroidia bacterium]